MVITLSEIPERHLSLSHPMNVEVGEDVQFEIMVSFFFIYFSFFPYQKNNFPFVYLWYFITFSQKGTVQGNMISKVQHYICNG